MSFILSKTQFAAVLTAVAVAVSAVAEEHVGGVVVDASGAPVAAAKVWVTQEGQAKPCVTNDKGEFNVREVGPGYADVVALKDGLALGGGKAFTVGGANARIVLGAPGTLTFRTVDEKLLPLPGVRVKSMLVNDTCFVLVDDLVTAGFPPLRSGDDGVLEIPFLPADGHVRLVLSQAGRVDAQAAYLPVGGKRQDLVVPPGIEVRGRVTNNGKGVPGTEVVVFRETATGNSEHGDVRTDPEGFYRLAVKPGEYFLGARHPEYGSPTPVAVAATVDAPCKPMDLALEPARHIEGSVQYPTKKPCGGAQVIFRAENNITDMAYSGEDGRFSVKAAAPKGTLSIVPPAGFMVDLYGFVAVEAPEKADAESAPSQVMQLMHGDISVDMKDKDKAKLNPIKLKPLPEVTGLVVTEDGQPVPRAVICSLEYEMPVWAIANEGGEFRIQLNQMPDQRKTKFRAEHALRFLRADFEVDLDHTKQHKIELKSYEPDQEKHPTTPGRNNLTMLLDKPAPEIKCSDWFNSKPLTLPDLKGKVVVLTFWGGFDESIYGLARMNEMYVLSVLLADIEDVAFVGVHDAGNEPEEIKEYVEKLGIPFPVGRDADPFVSFINYNINFIPQTVLIDKEGILRFSEVDGRVLELIKVLRRNK